MDNNGINFPSKGNGEFTVVEKSPKPTLVQVSAVFEKYFSNIREAKVELYKGNYRELEKGIETANDNLRTDLESFGLAEYIYF